MWKWNVIKKKLGLTRTLTTIGLIEYDREKLLGQGTFGKVYHGEYAGIEVAVKKVLIYRSKSFLTEEEALKKIDHPNVIKLFHCESDLDFRYIRKLTIHNITFFFYYLTKYILLGTTLYNYVHVQWTSSFCQKRTMKSMKDYSRRKKMSSSNCSKD